MRNMGRICWPRSASRLPCNRPESSCLAVGAASQPATAKRSRLACLTVLALVAGCERGVGPPPTVPLEAANAELVALIDDLLGSVRSLPESAEMRGRLGMAYEVNDFYTEAAAAYAQAEQLDPTDFRWPYFRAVLAAEAGDFERALPIIESAVALDSEYVPAWLYMGVWLNALGRYADAREAFARAHALGAIENADSGTARALIGERRFEEALAVLVPLVDKVKHPQVYRLLGRAYQALGRSDDARIAMARGREAGTMAWRDPLQHQKWRFEASLGRRLMHAQRLLEANRFQEAVDVLEPLYDTGVEESAVYVNLALAYARSGQTERAVEVAEKGMALSPDNYRYQNVFAGIYQNEGDDSRAMDHLQRSVELHPVQVWPYERMAKLLMDRAEYVAALAAVDDALRYGAEGQPQLYYTAGLLEGVQERWPEAIERFEQATALDASYTMAYIYLGRCLAEVGRVDDARKALAWARRLDTHPKQLESAEKLLDDIVNDRAGEGRSDHATPAEASDAAASSY